MKRIFTLILLVVLAVVLSACGNQKTDSAKKMNQNKGGLNNAAREAQSSSNETNISKELQAILDEYLAKEADARQWEVLDKKVSPNSIERSGVEVVAVFDVERTHRLNYAKAEDAPALKGRLTFMRESEGQLTKNQLDAANKEIDIWRHDLKQYISNDQYSFARIKVTATLDSNGKLKRDSVRFYVEQDSAKGVMYVPYAIEDIPSPQMVEKDAYDTISTRVKNAK